MTRLCITGAVALTALAMSSPVKAQQIPQDRRPFYVDALRPRGQNVIPIYDGWFENPDGTYTLCFGYFNLNTEQEFEIPLGSENYIEPMQYDGVQPTHFDAVPDPALTREYRHHWCVFPVTVPEDFGSGDVVWRLTSQGTELSVPGSLLPAYVLEEPNSSGRAAVAPLMSLEENAQKIAGRRGVRGGPHTVAIGQPLTLTAWIQHPEPGTWLGWTKHQGPGEVIFSESEVRLDTAEGAATISARFNRPGNYIVRVQAINDPEADSNPTGGFEFHCCWTNGYIEVDVVD
jgi:hypothetical protein